MKRLAFVAAVLAVSACSKGDNAAKDTAAPAMAPAPAPAAAADTGMKMADTTKKMDTTKVDSAKKAGAAAGASAGAKAGEKAGAKAGEKAGEKAAKKKP